MDWWFKPCTKTVTNLFDSAQTLQVCFFAVSSSKIEAGTTEKLGANDEAATCSFEHWMRLQAHHHIKMGMDTPFLMPNDTWTSEINLFECFNKILNDVKPWSKQLNEDGVLPHGEIGLPVCPMINKTLSTQLCSFLVL